MCLFSCSFDIVHLYFCLTLAEQIDTYFHLSSNRINEVGELML